MRRLHRVYDLYQVLTMLAERQTDVVVVDVVGDGVFSKQHSAK